MEGKGFLFISSSDITVSFKTLVRRTEENVWCKSECFLQGLGVFLTISVLLQTISVLLQPLMEVTLTLPGLYLNLAATALLAIFFTNFGVYEIKSKTLKVPDWLRCLFRDKFYKLRPYS